jgi:hypothetical protein
VIKPNKGVVIFGAIMLVGIQIAIILELVAKAKVQNWKHFGIDLGVLYVLALATGAIMAEAVISRRKG